MRTLTIWPGRRPAAPAPVCSLLGVGIVAGLLGGLSGCHARPAAPPASLIPARALSRPSSAVAQVRSSPLFRQARKECRAHAYRRAADHLQALARTPGLSADALAYCNSQRDLCLKDAGLLPAASSRQTMASPPLSALVSDSDCGPRALLLVCQKLGVKAALPQLTKAAATTSAGTTLAGLAMAAKQAGLSAEGVQVSREALPETSLPALAWVNRDHYVALLALSGSGDSGIATIHDPNHAAEETISQEQLLQRSGGVLLLIHR